MYGKRTKSVTDEKQHNKTLDEDNHITHSYVEETDSPDEVLQRVNEILSAHNLEIVEVETEDPDYPIVFTIEELS